MAFLRQWFRRSEAEFDYHVDDAPPAHAVRWSGMQEASYRCRTSGHKWERRWQRSGTTWWRDCERCDVTSIAVEPAP